MLPFDMDVTTAPIFAGPLTLDALVHTPTIKDFDPTVEKLAFTLNHGEADAVLFLHDLLDGSGVQVEVNGRLMVTLLGCSSDEFPEDCLTFETND